MAQIAKIVDVTKSFVPVDRRTFPENLLATQAEDYPNYGAPVVPYAGHNFLPTSYGYKSYFGTNAALAIGALTSKVDKVFIFQTETFDNILVALCEDGIWTCGADATASWVHEVTLSILPDNEKADWTYCVIEKGLYCYRAGGSTVYFLHPNRQWLAAPPAIAPVMPITVTALSGSLALPAGAYKYQLAVKDVLGNVSAENAGVSITITSGQVIWLLATDIGAIYGYRLYRTNPSGIVQYRDLPTGNIDFIDTTYLASDWVITTLPDYDGYYSNVDPTKFRSFVPSFLNLSGQEGIFRAGQRLGFWDNENSVAWSSIDDYTDFTPSVSILAGSAIFAAVTGRITTIKPHGDGFIIYAKKSIIYVRRAITETFQWDPIDIFTDNGVAFSEEICVGNPDTIHYAWTTAGIVKIESGKQEIIIPEIREFLKDSQDPIFLHLIENRYLAFQIIDPAYIDGTIELSTSAIPSLAYNFPQVSEFGDLQDPLTVYGNQACSLYGAGRSIHDSQGAIQNGSGGSSDPSRNSAYYQSVYKANFSQAGLANPDGITWGTSPCSVVNYDGGANPYPMSPTNRNPGKLAYATQDYSNKLDGGNNWNTESFYAAQIAIWAQGDKMREAFIEEVLNRAHSSSQVLTGQGSCSATGPNYSFCDQGDWIKDVSEPYWGITECSFYVYRYVISKINFTTVTTSKVECNPTTDIPATVNWEYVSASAGTFGPFASLAEATAYAISSLNSDGVGAEIPDLRLASGTFLKYVGEKAHVDGSGGYINIAGNGFVGCVASGACPSGYTAVSESDGVGGVYPLYCHPTSITYTKTTTVGAHIQGTVSNGNFGTDVGILELIGWNYHNPVTGVTTFVTRTAGQCEPPTTSNNKPSAGGGYTGITGNLPLASVDGSICGQPFVPFSLSGLSIDPVTWLTPEVAIPGDSFLLQQGSIGPKYPDFYGAFIYDTHLKKWGKYKDVYKALLDYSPINSSSGNIVPYATFGMNAGVIKSNGYLYLFDSFPDESILTYGKIGYSRGGMTNLETVRAYMKELCDVTIMIDGSLDGVTLETGLVKLETFTDTTLAEISTDFSGHWFNINLSGRFDLTHLEFIGVKSSRR